jgi:hypothetical protein
MYREKYFIIVTWWPSPAPSIKPVLQHPKLSTVYIHPLSLMGILLSGYMCMHYILYNAQCVLFGFPMYVHYLTSVFMVPSVHPDRLRLGHQPLKVFEFLILILNFLVRVQSSEPLHTKNTSNNLTSSKGGLCVHKQPNFPPNLVPKKCGNYTFYVWRWFGVSQMGRKTGRPAHWWIFSSNKSAPANRKKGFYSGRLPQ